MKLEQREKTKSLELRTADVIIALDRLNYMPKFPAEKDMQFIAGLIARFVQTVEVNHTHPDDPDNPAYLGWVNPLDWLVAEIGATCIYFPAPIQFRRAYGQKFVCLDKRTANEMELAIESQKD